MKKKAWGDIYTAAVRRGYDHGYAAWLADQWERRKQAEKPQ
jgi:hypothetical protein